MILILYLFESIVIWIASLLQENLVMDFLEYQEIPLSEFVVTQKQN